MNDTSLERLFLFNDLGFHLTPSLNFDHHRYITADEVLKFLGFIKCNTVIYNSIICVSTLYFSLVHSKLEYVVMWDF